MTKVLQWSNVVLRGIMEFGIVLGLGYWGFRIGSNTGMKIILGVIIPLLTFGFWGAFDFRNFGSYSEYLRLIQELIITGLVAFALYWAGSALFAFILAGISIIHHALVYVLGDKLLK